MGSGYLACSVGGPRISRFRGGMARSVALAVPVPVVALPVALGLALALAVLLLGLLPLRGGRGRGDGRHRRRGLRRALRLGRARLLRPLAGLQALRPLPGPV